MQELWKFSHQRPRATLDTACNTHVHAVYGLPARLSTRITCHGCSHATLPRQIYGIGDAGLRTTPQTFGRRLLCRSISSVMQDPADVIPSAEDSDDEEEGRVKPSEAIVLVVGAGPVGIITAMYLARRGYNVQLLEKSADPAEDEGMAVENDFPLILSSRCLLAFEELGATDLLKSLATTSLHGRWWVNGTPPGHPLTLYPPQPPTPSTTSTSTSSSVPQPTGPTSASAGRASVVDVTGAGGGTGRAVLEEYPGWNQRFTRRVLVSRRQLVRSLLEEAEKLYADKISLYYSTEFLDVDWDRKTARVLTPKTNASGGDISSTSGQPSSSTAATEREEVWVPYNLVVGADGPDSTVREVIGKKRPKITDYSTQRPMRDTRQWKAFDSLRQVPSSGEIVPGMSSHVPREYEYVYEAPGSPTLKMWVAAEGLVCGNIIGVERWEAAALTSELQQAYGYTLPKEWLDEIVLQTCSHASPAPCTYSSTVQCSQFHASGIALVGDAAHAMTGEYDQGLSCAVEGVRLLNLALKSTKDSIDRAVTLYSEVRCEDVHSMQQLEFFQRSTKPGLQYGDFVYSVAAWLGAAVWKCAQVMMALVRQFMPSRFPPTYVTDRLWDARRGYNDLLKVVVRFAALPLLCALVLLILGLRALFIQSGKLV